MAAAVGVAVPTNRNLAAEMSVSMVAKDLLQASSSALIGCSGLRSDSVHCSLSEENKACNRGREVE